MQSMILGAVIGLTSVSGCATIEPRSKLDEIRIDMVCQKAEDVVTCNREDINDMANRKGQTRILNIHSANGSMVADVTLNGEFYRFDNGTLNDTAMFKAAANGFIALAKKHYSGSFDEFVQQLNNGATNERKPRRNSLATARIIAYQRLARDEGNEFTEEQAREELLKNTAVRKSLKFKAHLYDVLGEQIKSRL